MAKKKQDELDSFLQTLNNNFGQGSASRMSDKPKEFEAVPSGSMELDSILGGGFPRGRVIEIYGQEATGKTHIALKAIAESQKQGKRCAIIDVEHALDPDTASKLGVDMDTVVISQPDDAETALEIGRSMVKSELFDVILLDSVAALSTKAEVSGTIGEAKMASTARVMGQALRIMVSEISKSKTCFIFINQLREKLGVMFGNPETTSGGNALKFYASVRCEIRRSLKTSDGETTGFTQKIKIVKNKLAPAYKKMERYIDFTTGIDPNDEIVDLGVEYEIIKKSGSWYSYDETKLGQGRKGALAILSDNPELCEEISDKIKEKLAQ